MVGDGSPLNAGGTSGPECDSDSRRDDAVQVLAARDRILQLIGTGQPLDLVLEAIVETVEAHCRGSIGSVLLLDDDGEHLRLGVAPRLPASYNRAVDGLRIGPRAGSCGTAAYRGEPVVAENIATDPLWEDYRDLAREHDLAACWSRPVLSAERKVLGTFAIYYRQPRRPDAGDEEFIGGMANLAGIAIERDAADRKRRATERRLLKQKTVLVELAKSDALADSDFTALCRLATEAASDTLDVERVGVWLLNDDRTVLHCEELYEHTLDQHSHGIELDSRRYPRYFAALERGRSVVAHDARRDPDTDEFTESYLVPLGITSMLDTPIRRSGKLVGVVCHEHVGPRRVWAADEQEFAASVGDFVSLGLEASERRRAEQAFRSAQEELLRQGFQARRQIEFELGRMKDELVRQTRLATIGQVAASIAHELRNPLGAIRNAAYFLRRHVPESEPKWADYLGIIEQEIRRADATINDLLEVSQPKEPVKEDVDIAALVRDAYGSMVSGDAIELLIRADREPFWVAADGEQLRQVITNLLSNAIDAVGDRGRITVEAHREDADDVIVVQDSGPGIPGELRDRVFEPLITTKVKGTGLGLSICRQILERHGGSIEVLDRSDSGAAFRLRLPRATTG